MAPITISTNGVFKFAFGCVAVSAVSALAFLAGSQVSSVRGAAGGVGFMAGLIGSGVAIWFSIREKDQKLRIVALLSALPLAFWGWVMYRIVHGSV